MRINVLVFYDSEGKRVLGSDGSILTNLKTRKGIITRYKNHIDYMESKGYIFIIVPYNYWVKYVN